MACSAANAGRMRLVWGRLWAVTAPHLVAACCARDDDVALLAAGQLAGLAARLLGRSEQLSNFAHQVRCRQTRTMCAQQGCLGTVSTN